LNTQQVESCNIKHIKKLTRPYISAKFKTHQKLVIVGSKEKFWVRQCEVTRSTPCNAHKLSLQGATARINASKL